MVVALDELLVADRPQAWADAGFTVEGDLCRVGSVGIRLVGPGERRGIVGWALAGLPVHREVLDGVPTSNPAGPREDGDQHPNGVTTIDHVVLMSPHLTRTVDALRDVGLEPRRERDAELGGADVRQIFYRLDDVILELVGDPAAAGDGPSSLWGVTFNVADIDATAAFFGERTSRVRAAVQPGRRITTLRHRELDMSVRTALMSPHRRGPGSPSADAVTV